MKSSKKSLRKNCKIEFCFKKKETFNLFWQKQINAKQYRWFNDDIVYEAK